MVTLITHVVRVFCLLQGVIASCYYVYIKKKHKIIRRFLTRNSKLQGVIIDCYNKPIIKMIDSSPQFVIDVKNKKTLTNSWQ
jgi:DNA polymerase sigma